MSQSRTAPAPPTRGQLSERAAVADGAVQGLLDALDDADCRAILAATSDEALSAKEVAGTCDLPLSTAYRKLGLLVDVGMIEERTRIRRHGKHASEYVRSVDEVVVALGARGELEIAVDRREAADRRSRA
ncbi:MAG: helix-turn-helix domain-containing protein [Haloferacaceae archaeon]